MRVVVVDPSAQMPAYDHTLCAALGASGHEVELATRFTHPRGPRPAGFRRSEPFGPLGADWLTQHPGSPAGALLELAGLLGGYATLRRRVRRERWDIADWQAAPLLPFDIASLTAIRRHSCAVVFTAHDSLPTRKPWTVPLWRRLFRACDRVVVRSQHGKQKLLDQFGLMAEHVAVIPHALPLLTVTEPPVEPDAPAILFFGAIGADQGLDLLIEALPQVATAVPAVQLLVVGEPRGPLEPLLERAKVLRVSERIVWDTRFVSNEELPSIFARASVVALACHAMEGEGVLPLALAAGVPVVGTSVGSLPDLMAAYDLGEPVAPTDSAALAAALTRILTDKDARGRATEGMARARNELSWSAIAGQTEALYRELLA